MAQHRKHVNRMSDPEGCTPLFVGLARARFGLGEASSGLAADWMKAFGGRNWLLHHEWYDSSGDSRAWRFEARQR